MRTLKEIEVIQVFVRVKFNIGRGEQEIIHRFDNEKRLEEYLFNNQYIINWERIVE